MSDNVTVKKDKTLLLAPGPHIASPENSTGPMRNMLIALTPVSVFGVFIFGLPALLNIIVAVAAAVLGESLFRIIIRRPVRAKDLSAGVSGLLLALIIPPSMPLWMTALGSFFAVIVAKEFFGGLGANVFNPALIGRAFLLMSFPAAMTTWHHPGKFPLSLTDAVSGASPLGVYSSDTGCFAPSSEGYWQSMKELFWGYHAGSTGETSVMLILSAFLFLLVTKTVDWRAPVSMTVAAAALSFAVGICPLFTVLSGGLIFGAVFMATDYVTAPVTPWGKIIFGAGAGIIAVLIRRWGGYPEGTSYGILIMNCAVPFLNKLLIRKYGYAAKKKPAKRQGGIGDAQ